MKRLFESHPHLMFSLSLWEGGAKRRVRVNRVFRCRECPNSRCPLRGLASCFSGKFQPF